MLSKLNPVLREYNSLKVPRLGKDWQSKIPNREQLWEQYLNFLEVENLPIEEAGTAIDDNDAEFSDNEEM